MSRDSSYEAMLLDLAELAASAFELLAVGYVGLVVVQIVVGHLLSLVPTYVPRLVS